MKGRIQNQVNNRGITLVEVLITLAVLGIMAVPIFNTFMESMTINHKTMVTVSANHIGQKVLEQLKAEGSIDGFVKDDSATVETYNGTVDGYDVVYTITEIEGLTYAPDATATVDYGTQVDVATSNIKLLYQKATEEEDTHFLYESNNIAVTWTKLLIEDNGSAQKVSFYKVSLGDGGTNVYTLIGSSQDIPVGSQPLKIVVQIVGTPDAGRLDVENKSLEEVAVYEVDDGEGLLDIIPNMTANAGELQIYRNVKSDVASDDNEKRAYRVDVKISRNSDVLEQLLGTIVK
ncbi:MAG: prepilin-type N-terminal cleavage/methylation domain-containing protein [Clostridia bacterium]|nr:prepilin-type N-terminal cleavage/methylation domain-containing protein [Clostridia bacterium]